MQISIFIVIFMNAWTEYRCMQFLVRLIIWIKQILPWWRRHQMETFSALLDICAGEFPAQRLVTWSLDVFFDLPTNKQLSKQSWGWWFEMPSCSLWRQCNDEITLVMSNRIYRCQLFLEKWCTCIREINPHKLQIFTFNEMLCNILAQGYNKIRLYASKMFWNSSFYTAVKLTPRLYFTETICMEDNKK